MRPVCPSTSLFFLLTTECLLPVKPSSCPTQISSTRNARGAHPHSPPHSTTNASCMPAAKYGWTDGEYLATWMQTSSLRLQTLEWITV
ncbi:hypothetical protein B0H14DRAFT_2925662 [Mycena olivaceomarginata]|nr:hypothetical protein B0H14DRAFT_2925662 [Mycena olivaceomarginata]